MRRRQQRRNEVQLAIHGLLSCCRRLCCLYFVYSSRTVVGGSVFVSLCRRVSRLHTPSRRPASPTPISHTASSPHFDLLWWLMHVPDSGPLPDFWPTCQSNSTRISTCSVALLLRRRPYSPRVYCTPGSDAMPLWTADADCTLRALASA